MLSKENRFHGHHSLDFTYKRGQTVRAETIGLRYAKSKSGSYRVAVVVSKKIQKSAVARNRIRRRIYEALRTVAQEVKLPQNDMIFTVYSEKVIDTAPQRLRNEIKDLVEKSQGKPAQSTGR